MAEQNFHQAIKIADRGYIIVHGRIEFEGHTAQELSENTLVKQYYLGVYQPRDHGRDVHLCLAKLGL